MPSSAAASVIRSLETENRRIVGECLQAAASGPFFPDWEFQTLLGVDRTTLRAIANEWPNQAVDDEVFVPAIVNTLNNLTGYPHGKQSAWQSFISVPPEAVVVILRRLLST